MRSFRLGAMAYGCRWQSARRARENFIQLNNQFYYKIKIDGCVGISTVATSWLWQTAQKKKEKKLNARGACHMAFWYCFPTIFLHSVFIIISIIDAQILPIISAEAKLDGKREREKWEKLFYDFTIYVFECITCSRLWLNASAICNTHKLPRTEHEPTTANEQTLICAYWSAS